MRSEYEEKGVGFLALCLEQDDGLVLDAARKLDLKLRVGVARSEVLAPFSVSQVPSTVLLDKDGNIVAAASGERHRDFFENRVKELLTQ